MATGSKRKNSKTNSSEFSIYVSIFGNLIVATAKFFAAIYSGSSAMLSEGFHSIIDAANAILLYYGIKKAKAAPDSKHPLGYGREIYFWSFIVAVLFFAFGAGISLYEGISQILKPEPLENVTINYIVYAVSAIFDGSTWYVSYRQFHDENGDLGILDAVKKSKNPPSFMLFFEDCAGMIGLAIAVIGTFISSYFEFPLADGIASILVALVLGTMAGIVAFETKGLLIGEAAEPEVIRSISSIAESVSGVNKTNGVTTIHVSPDEIVVSLSIEFNDDLKTGDIEKIVVEVERKLKQEHQEIRTIFIKPQTAAGFKKTEEERKASLQLEPQS